MNNNSNKYTSHEIRYLDYISEFTTDIQYIKWKNNTVSGTFSETHMYALDTDVPLIADEQKSDSTLNDVLADTSLDPQKFLAPLSNRTLYRDIILSRSHVPPSLRRLVFEHLHGLSHPNNEPQSNWSQNVLCGLI